MQTAKFRNAFYVPVLASLYARLDAPAETFLRVMSGLALVTHGFPKLMDPFGSVQMVEGLGFYPGVL